MRSAAGFTPASNAIELGCPDQHVAWRSNALPAAPAKTIDRVLGLGAGA